jgi:GNAT superfamily N-acetyltransferase
MNKILIEPIKKSDYEKVAQLVNKVTKTAYEGYYSSEVIKNKSSYTAKLIAEKVAEGNYLVAKDGDCVVGVVGLVRGSVKMFFVDFKYQRQGLGRKLYAQVEALALSQNRKSLRLYSSLPAIPFYKKLGFIIVKEFASELHGGTHQSTLLRKIL